MRFGVWLLALAACRIGFDKRAGDGGAERDDAITDVGAPAAFEPYWTSGSRMRARLLAPGDGSDPFWIGWRDTVLGMDCRPGPAADGVERCVHGDVRAGRYYGDAGCTVRLAHVRNRTCGDAGTHAFYVDGASRFRVHTVGAAYTGTVFEDTGSGCVPSLAPPGGPLHMLGAELPAASMLASQYMNRPMGAYLRPTQGFVDGSYLEIGSVALTTSGGCFPVADTLGASHCRANVPRATAVYSDAACTQPAYYWDRQSYESATTTELVVIDAAACETSSKFYMTTSDITAATHYVRTATGCTPRTASALGKLYTATEITNPYPIGTVVIGPRRGRLGYLYWIGPDDVAIATHYWDHDVGLPCLPMNGSDGKLHCLPRKLSQIAAYNNGTCSGTPSQLTPACFPGTPVDGPGYQSCTDNWIVGALPTSSTTASVFTDSCTAFDVPGGVYDPTQPGTVLPPTMFAELAEIIE